MFFYTCVILIGYLSGSISTAILACKIMGLGDPRREGSGNPGATNVLRLYGKQAATVTLGGDVLKGVVPVLLAKLIQAPDVIIAITALAAFFGHLLPVFFRFQGGKGVATFLGVLSATYWLLGLAFMGTWILAALLFRYSSLAAITASIMTLLYTWWLLPAPAYVICFSFMVCALIWRHRSNMSNLIAGTEDKIGMDKA